MTNFSPTALERPANAAPWAKRDPKVTLLIILGSILPASISAFLAVSFSLKFELTLLAIFLPLQIIAGLIVGSVAAGKRGRGEALLGIFTFFFSALVFVLLLSVLWSVVANGAQAMSWQFITQNNVYISSNTSLEYGGVGHSVIGTVLVVGLATLVTVPLGILIAVYLTETRGKTRGLIRTLIQAMSGLPSVVSGLFVYAAFIVTGITEYAGWAGSLALLPLMLPTVSRIAEESLRLVPADLRSAAVGLGAPNYRAFLQVVMPAAKSGLVTAILLGIARIIGETAPLILTTFATPMTSLNVFSGPMSTLPTYLYGFISNPSAQSVQRAWGAALVMLILVGVLLTAARVMTRSRIGKKSKKNGK
jgi:phosphate transport system permease protein